MTRSHFALLIALLSGASARATVIHVPGGGDLQAAINKANAGDTITLAPGWTYTGNFKLVRKAGTSYTTITTADPSSVPPEGQRISPAMAAKLPRIVSPNGLPAVLADSNAHHYRLRGIEITSARGMVSDALISITSVPFGPAFEIVLEQLYVHGGATRGIALNGASITIRDCYISDIYSAGALAQAIAGSSGSGPFTIENNYVESSGQNIAFGDMPAQRPGIVPSGISIERNVLAKPKASDGTQWRYADLVQLSNAEGVTIRGNTLDTGAATDVYAFAIGDRQVENATVRGVVFSSNLVRSAGRAISVIGSAGRSVTDIEISDNDLLTTDNVEADSDLISIEGPVEGLTIARNDGSTPSSLIHVSGLPSGTFVLRENTFHYGSALVSENSLVSRPFSYYFPNGNLSENVFTGPYSGEEPEIVNKNRFPLVARKPRRRMTDSTPIAPPMPAITPQYFGLHVTPTILNGRGPWPAVGFGAMRLLGDVVNWNDVNPSPGVFDFSKLDPFLAKAKAQGITEIVYNMSKTPTWASSQPTRASCSDYLKRPGACAPPDDLNSDGTGTNQHWKDYITAVANHAAGQRPGQIKYWEVWNEPNAKNMWVGTNAQLVRMAQDAWTIIKSIDPLAVILTPPAAGGGEITGASWLDDYLAAGGGVWADVISFHGYIDPSDVTTPETINSGLSVVLQARADYQLTNKPVWDSEASWSLNTRLPDPDLQVAFVARYYLLQSPSVSRFFWYQYDGGGEGTLIDLNTNKLTSAGTAYGELYRWLTGATPTGCSANGTVWTCGFTRPGGYQAIAVWDARTCTASPCPTSSYVPDASFVRMRDLSGQTGLISSPPDIGPKPILLENQ
jgi:hypothetical protein